VVEGEFDPKNAAVYYCSSVQARKGIIYVISRGRFIESKISDGFKKEIENIMIRRITRINGRHAYAYDICQKISILPLVLKGIWLIPLGK